MKIITDTELRATWSVNPFTEYEVEENTIVTPAARDFINEHGITLRVAQKDLSYRKMPYTPIPSCAAQSKYIDMQTGASMDEKPESMTHIRGNLLVPKNSPRIIFRGRLDSLEAKIMETQIIACDENYPSIAADLEELYLFVQAVLGAEVNETPLEEFHLLGMNSEEIRRVSHNVESE
jgi:ethanolamine utilization cobalamin adenosyltransferase